MSPGNAVVGEPVAAHAAGDAPIISCGCLQRFVKHIPVMVLEKRETVKAGSAGAGTV